MVVFSPFSLLLHGATPEKNALARSIVQLRADVHQRASVKRNVSQDFYEAFALERVGSGAVGTERPLEKTPSRGFKGSRVVWRFLSTWPPKNMAPL